jgi:hypothetical protein
LNQKSLIKALNKAKSRYDEEHDDIANSDVDSMFAFSQIISSGEKVSVVTKELEKDGETKNQNLDEDMAILEFSNTMPGNEGEPKHIEVDEQ